jgi:hypothetical protein
MEALDTISPLENRSDSQPHRRTIKVRGPASPGAVQEPRTLASTTERDQDSVIPKEYAVLVPDPLRQGSSGNLGIAALQQNERVGQRTARSSQRGKRNAPVTAERFWLLNRWQGQVLTVGQATFEAQLLDPAHPSVIDYAQFSMSEMSADGLALLRPGAVFYWIIGYRDLGSGERRRESVIWMRRGGRMGEDKFRAAFGHVEEIWGAVDERTKSAAGQG